MVFEEQPPAQDQRRYPGYWQAHAYQALDHDTLRMRTLLLMIAELYGVEKLAQKRGLSGEDLRLLREQGARLVLEKLHAYLLQIHKELLPRSEAGQAVNYRSNSVEWD